MLLPNLPQHLKTYLKSIFYCRYHKVPISEMFTNPDVPFAEGVVFTNQNPTLTIAPTTLSRGSLLILLIRSRIRWFSKETSNSTLIFKGGILYWS